MCRVTMTRHDIQEGCGTTENVHQQILMQLLQTTDMNNLPFCIVCLPPDNTPSGSVPVGVSPLRVSTLSLSSL